jgi:predicted metal-dependent hydrolase
MENEVLIERAKAFVQAVAAQTPWAEIEPYYAPDVSQEEFPNRLLPKGTVRNLEALRDASAKGRKVIKAQTPSRQANAWCSRRSGPARSRSASAR